MTSDTSDAGITVITSNGKILQIYVSRYLDIDISSIEVGSVILHDSPIIKVIEI